MAEKPKFTRTDKQKALMTLATRFQFILAEGGGRSGKTFEFCDIILIRALLVPSDHLIVRLRFSHAKRAICFQTMPRLLKAKGISTDVVRLNRTEWYYELPNGSRIWVAGLDQGDRVEKILGNDYSTIFLNEASEIVYDSYDLLLSRLVPAVGLRGRMLIDYNPPSRNHWGFKIFHSRQFPDGRPVPEDDYVSILMNPTDNPHLPAEYLKTLEGMSLQRQRRFLRGEYSDDQGTLWRRAYFHYRDEVPEPLIRVVIGVDPSGTVDGDEIGIVISASYQLEDQEKFLVLDDYSLHGTPKEWSDEVASAWDKWNADVIVAEKNFGGDMVADVIQRGHRSMNVKLITSSRSKIVRAEPISALYENGRVDHRVPFLVLEDELCQYEPGKSKSPNRMDALVFSLTELSGDGVSMLDVL